MFRKLLISSVLVVVTTVSVSAQTQSVEQLQSQLQQVLQRIAELRSQLQTPTSGTACGITATLKRGSSGGQVRALQTFLARDSSIYPEQSVTGTFGPATERAVQRFQSREGIVSGGTPFDTGYGVVGSRTRARVNELCGGGVSGGGGGSSLGSSPVARVVDLSFSGTPRAPWSAVAKFDVLDGACTSYEIDWGDGSDKESYAAQQTYSQLNPTSCGVGITSRSLVHQFTNSGPVTVTVRAVRGPLSQNMPVAFTKQLTIAPGDPYVKVLSPSVGSALRLGEYTKLKWEAANPPESAAIAFYMVGPTTTYSFAKRSLRSREFDWIVGDRVCDGNSCDVQMPAGQYKVRAVMYTPLDACIDFCTPNDPIAKVVATHETDSFSVGSIGVGGSSPINVSTTRGYAPLTANVRVEIQPTQTAQNFEVDFGDGTQKFTIAVPPGEARTTVRDVAHTFTKVGTFTVALRPVGAVQNVGSTTIAVDSPTFTLLPQSGSQAPTVVKATFPVDTSCALIPNVTRRYTVDWGDASETSVYDYVPTLCATSSSPGPQTTVPHSFTHAYGASGSRTVKLKAQSPSGSHEASAVVAVGAAAFSLSPSFGFAPFSTTATFTVDSGCSVNGAASKTYTIDWGDGSAVYTHTVPLPQCGASFVSSTKDMTTTHKYTAVGNYSAKLKIQRSDSSEVYTRSQEVVADKTAWAYTLRLVQHVFDNAQNGVATAAVSMYEFMNGYAGE